MEIEKTGQCMIEPNTINKIKNFSDNRKDSGYQLESSSGISPSVIIFGEKHSDKTERKDQEDLIKNLGLANFVLLAEDESHFESWKGKDGCEEVILCDLELKEKDENRKELLRKHLPPQEFERLSGIFDDSVETFFDNCVQRFPYLMQLFYDSREKKMGEIICSNHSKEPSKLIVVIIGSYHARKDSEVHKILEKNEIDHICIWNEKAVEQTKKKYQFFRRDSAQDNDMRL